MEYFAIGMGSFVVMVIALTILGMMKQRDFCRHKWSLVNVEYARVPMVGKATIVTWQCSKNHDHIKQDKLIGHVKQLNVNGESVDIPQAFKEAFEE